MKTHGIAVAITGPFIDYTPLVACFYVCPTSVYHSSFAVSHLSCVNNQ